MDAREILLSNLVVPPDKKISVQMTKSGLAYATKDRRVEFVIKVKKPKDVKKLSEFLRGIAVFLDNRFITNPKRLDAKVIVYDRAIGIKITKLSSKKELAEIVFSAEGKDVGARIMTSGELARPGFIDFAIEVMKNFAGVVGAKI